MNKIRRYILEALPDKPNIRGRQYWDRYLEYNKLRTDYETGAGGFLADRIENAGDIWREITGRSRPDVYYIREKIRKINYSFVFRDWKDSLSPTETKYQKEIDRNINKLPITSEIEDVIVYLLNSIIDRNISRIKLSLSQLEYQL